MTALTSVTMKGPVGVLDVEVRDFLEAFNEFEKSQPKVAFKNIAPEELRSGPSVTENYELAPMPVYVENLAFINRDGTQIELRIYRKELGQKASPLMFFHGGCWVFCSVDSHDAICRKLCHDTGFAVFSVDYRLAPEYKFPCGLHDCYDASKWVHENREELNLNSDEIIVCGDSAGGNLAASVSLMAKSSQELPIKAQVLFYPIADVSNLERESYQCYKVDYFLTRETIEACAEHYLESDDLKKEALVSPVYADLKGLPQTLIQTAEFDILRDEAEELADKLCDAGVDVECVRYNGQIHAYLAFAGGFKSGAAALDDAINYIKALD